jgi:hypothetical protein
VKTSKQIKTNDCGETAGGINQGSYAKNQMSWQWSPVNTSLPNTTRRKRHEKN